MSQPIQHVPGAIQQLQGQVVRPEFPDTLLIHTGPDSAIPLSLADNSPADPLVFGRKEYRNWDLTAALNFGEVSRNHCSVVVQDGRVLITDLNSRNGTSVNGVRLTAHEVHELKNGDTIILADRVEMVFIASRARAEGAPVSTQG
jgi:pSer/pThr/pTyr-binding forkhead associated (FHA) protein